MEQKELSDSFAFRGFIEEIANEFDNAHCYISTSKMEGLPLSVLSAMAYGLPVVASNVTGNIDIVKDNRNGYLFELDEPAAAAKALYLLYSDSDLFGVLSANARETVIENYNADRMADETLEQYRILSGVQ